MFDKCPQCGNEDLTEEIHGECHGMVAKALVCEKCCIIIDRY